MSALPRVPAADASLRGELELGATSVSLAVADLDASRTFYEARPQHPHLRPGPHERVERLESFTDVCETKAQLVDAGRELGEQPEPGSSGAAHLTLVGPDGNPVLVDQFF